MLLQDFALELNSGTGTATGMTHAGLMVQCKINVSGQNFIQVKILLTTGRLILDFLCLWGLIHE